MTRWWRFLFTLLTARRRMPVSIAEAAELEFRVWPTDCDAAFMNNSAFLVLCEAGRLDFMVRSGFFPILRRKGWYLPMAVVVAQFRRPVRRFAKVTVSTRAACWRESEIWVEHRVSCGGKLAAIAVARGVVKEGQRTLTLDEAFAGLWPGIASPELPAWIAQLKTADTAMREAVS